MTPLFTLDAIYDAWHAAGADAAGVSWDAMYKHLRNPEGGSVRTTSSPGRNVPGEMAFLGPKWGTTLLGPGWSRLDDDAIRNTLAQRIADELRYSGLTPHRVELLYETVLRRPT